MWTMLGDMKWSYFVYFNLLWVLLRQIIYRLRDTEKNKILSVPSVLAVIIFQPSETNLDEDMGQRGDLTHFIQHI